MAAVGWFYVVMALLGRWMSGTLSWSHLGGGAAAVAIGVALMLIEGRRQWARMLLIEGRRKWG
ncbi:hypothetical protein [Nocardia asteroides]|uniref:hypothetical protein n=1 Tax=Nocardia asteroides TaxID=1824 RepID=UPI001E2FEEB5|nr:hypothetical protein [Nocardia asteroides]UGT58931.1 hypothetical protein LTT85_33125 [Nocardia asteroides]